MTDIETYRLWEIQLLLETYFLWEIYLVPVDGLLSQDAATEECARAKHAGGAGRGSLLVCLFVLCF